MVKRGWEISGYSLSGLEMRWAAIWTVTQVSWQLWITPLRARDGFSGKDTAQPRQFDDVAVVGWFDGARVWRVLIQCPVSSVSVIVVEIAIQTPAEVMLAKHNDMVQALASKGPDYPVRHRSAAAVIPGPRGPVGCKIAFAMRDDRCEGSAGERNHRSGQCRSFHHASPLFPSRYQRLAPRIGHKRAIVAVAHALLVTGYLLVATGRKYEDLGVDYFDRLDRERLTKRLVKRLERLGHRVSLQPAA